MARALDAALLLASVLLPLAAATLLPAAGPEDPRCRATAPRRGALAVYPSDMEQLQFLLNAKFVEAEWFLHAALGRGVDFLDRDLSAGGPRPAGVRRASLDFRTTEVAAELGYQEVGHIRAIRQAVGGFPRPAIDLGADRFAMVMDDAMGARLDPPFDPYNSTVNFLLASYVFPHITAAATMGISSSLMGFVSKRLQSSILAVEAGQDAVIRLLLYQRADEAVPPYQGHTVADFTRRISEWRNRMSGCGAKDEGVKVLDRQLGAERRTISNILGAGEDSLGFQRTPAEVLRILYGSRNEQIPGGFLPRGANGTIARGFFQLA
ncbi:desiccation-related protein PCC13-62-like [Panicum miliaceum]|uniref:Desiccation-related protein PCC13-62-like n=1 Tax=Panicum miliaceum TaxID=4540 RepID=A0A3L6SV54_PANMI|nr:desiccation-related protein PCC13-62-like [Panicum miliaceum]